MKIVQFYSLLNSTLRPDIYNIKFYPIWFFHANISHSTSHLHPAANKRFPKPIPSLSDVQFQFDISPSYFYNARLFQDFRLRSAISLSWGGEEKKLKLDVVYLNRFAIMIMREVFHFWFLQHLFESNLEK